MIITCDDCSPRIHPTAWVAPDATVCGDVTIGAHSRILYGARIIAEGGSIEIGSYVIVLENGFRRGDTIVRRQSPAFTKRFPFGASVFPTLKTPMKVGPRTSCWWAMQPKALSGRNA